MQKANLMNFDHNRKKINVSNDIFQNVGTCYVSPLPNAICKSPATKLNDSTFTHRSFLKERFAIVIKPQRHCWFFKFPFPVSGVSVIAVLRIVLGVICLFF